MLCVGPGVPNPLVGRVTGLVVVTGTTVAGTCVAVGVDVGVAVGVTGGCVHPAVNSNTMVTISVRSKIRRFMRDDHANFIYNPIDLEREKHENIVLYDVYPSGNTHPREEDRKAMRGMGFEPKNSCETGP